jgi:hypothetical protein
MTALGSVCLSIGRARHANMSVATILNPLSAEGRASWLLSRVVCLPVSNTHPAAKGEHYVQDADHIIADILSPKPGFLTKVRRKIARGSLKAVLI